MEGERSGNLTACHYPRKALTQSIAAFLIIGTHCLRQLPTLLLFLPRLFHLAREKSILESEKPPWNQWAFFRCLLSRKNFHSQSWSYCVYFTKVLKLFWPYSFGLDIFVLIVVLKKKNIWNNGWRFWHLVGFKISNTVNETDLKIWRQKIVEQCLAVVDHHRNTLHLSRGLKVMKVYQVYHWYGLNV